jgi:hypothetical protein
MTLGGIRAEVAAGSQVRIEMGPANAGVPPAPRTRPDPKRTPNQGSYADPAMTRNP